MVVAKGVQPYGAELYPNTPAGLAAKGKTAASVEVAGSTEKKASTGSTDATDQSADGASCDGASKTTPSAPSAKAGAAVASKGKEKGKGRGNPLRRAREALVISVGLNMAVTYTLLMALGTFILTPGTFGGPFATSGLAATPLGLISQTLPTSALYVPPPTQPPSGPAAQRLSGPATQPPSHSTVNSPHHPLHPTTHHQAW